MFEQQVTLNGFINMQMLPNLGQFRFFSIQFSHTKLESIR